MDVTAGTAPRAPEGAAARPGRLAALRRPHLLVLAAITVAAAGLRLAVIAIPSYWLDEAYTVLILDGSLGHALDLIPKTESTPPLYYLLAWGWAKAFGIAEAGVRSLSTVFGVATVPVVYAAAARLVDRRTGLVAAALVAFNPFLVWFAQEARAYALMLLLAAIGFLLFVRLVQQPDRRTVVWWAVVSALTLATHYYAILMILAEAGWLLWTQPRLRRPVLAGLALVAATGLALVPLVAAQYGNRLAVPLSEDSSTVLRTLQVPKQFLIGFDAPAEWALGVASLALVAGGVALLLLRRTRAERDALAPAFLVGAAVIVVPVLLALLGFDFVSARYEVGALLPLAICVAAGYAAPRARRLGIALCVALCALWLGIVVAVARDPLLHTRADWRTAAEALGPPPAGGRAVVLTPTGGGKSFEVYLPDARYLRAPLVSVEEVVLLAVRSTSEERLAPRRPTPGAANPALPPAFTETERRVTRTYVLIRYRAPGPVPVELQRFSAARLDPLDFVVFVQRP